MVAFLCGKSSGESGVYGSQFTCATTGQNTMVLFCFVLFCSVFWLREKGGDGLKPDGVGNYLGAVRGKNVKRRPPAGAHFQLYPKLYSAFPLYVRSSFPSIARTSDPDALIKFPPF